MIIGLGGKIGSGKTEVGNYLSKKFNLPKIAFADELKKIVYDISNLNDLNKKDITVFNGNIDIKIINSLLKRYNYKFLTQYEIDTLKAIEYHNNAQVYRSLCQYLGTEIFRKRNINHWVEIFINNVSKYKNGFICDDIRFPNEHNAIKCRFKDNYIKTIKIINTNIISTDSHESENLFNRIQFDEILINKGLDLNILYNEVDNLFKNVK